MTFGILVSQSRYYGPDRAAHTHIVNIFHGNTSDRFALARDNAYLLHFSKLCFCFTVTKAEKHHCKEQQYKLTRNTAQLCAHTFLLIS